MATPAEGSRSARGASALHDGLAAVVDAGGLHLEGVAVTPAGKRRVVRVVVDLPEDRVGSVDLDAVADVSRAVSDALDGDLASHLGGAPFVLEVTTPGVDRPLTERRHWARARTRLVAVTVTAEGAARELTGRVVAVDDDGVRFEVDGEEQEVAWDGLGTGRTQVEFRRPEADDEADETDDADEADETEADDDADDETDDPDDVVDSDDTDDTEEG